MSARRRTQTQDVGGQVAPKRLKALESDTCSFIIQEAISPTFDPTKFLQRRVFFVNKGKSRYVSSGFYAARNYQVLVEFVGPRITSTTPTEQHVRTLE
jgi:hypothetical protein